MPLSRRPVQSLAIASAIAVLSTVLVAVPAVAANHAVTADVGQTTSVEAAYGPTTWGVTSATTSLRLHFPDDVLDLGLTNVGYTITTINGSWKNGSYSYIGSLSEEVVVNLNSSLADYGGSDFVLSVFNASDVLTDPVFDLPTVDRSAARFMLLTTHLSLGSVGGTSPIIPFAPEYASTYKVAKSYTATEVSSAWGDTITVSAPFASGTPTASVRSADGASTANLTVSGSGATRTITLPSSSPANVDWSTGSAVTLKFAGSGVSDPPSVSRSARVTIPINLFPTSRIAGADRYSTAAKVSAQFATASTIYIASGVNYPDALSAAPAAAHLDAPLLLTAPDSLPTVIANEIKRLDPTTVIIAGGLAAVSKTVENQLNAIVDGDVRRIAGANRYETSRRVTDDAFGTAASAFLATGTNFPDALAASAAAAHVGAPVVLIPGAGSSVDQATQTLLTQLAATKIYLAGGTAVISSAIKAQLEQTYVVTRLAGIDRYGTSVAINTLFAPPNTTVYLAVGTGYADALAGAALAGANDAPLFTVPGTCVPTAVLDALDTLGATDITLLGGTAVLTLPVARLVPC